MGFVPRHLRHRRRHGFEKELAEERPEFKRLTSVAKGSWGVTDIFAWTGEGAKTKFVAITFVPRGARVTSRLREDIKAHYKMGHPHLVNILEVFVLKNHLAIVKEYIDSPSLLACVEKLDTPMKEDHVRWFFQQYVIALDYLHRRDIPHKDIKLDNAILVPTNKKVNRPPMLKFTGFKLSMHDRKHNNSLTASTRCYEYNPPELWGASIMCPHNDKAADMWALGVVLYRLLFGDYPFPRLRRNVADSEAHNLLSNVEFPEDSIVSDSAKSLVKGLLAFDVADRLTIQDVLRNAWFLQDIPQGVLDMNDKMEGAPHPHYNYKESLEDIDETLWQARKCPLPNHIWDQLNCHLPDEYDDHEEQMMSPEECQDWSQVMSMPNSGKDIIIAE